MALYEPAQLPLIEKRLFELSTALDDPVPMEIWKLAELVLARRGRALYRGVIDAAMHSSEAAALSVLRSMVELVILIPWLALRPELYPDLWGAESDRLDLAMRAQLDAKTIISASRPMPEKSRREKLAEVRKWREAGIAAGLPWVKATGSLLPPLEQMTEHVNDVMVWEAYAALYRYTSMWSHSEATSFKKTLTVGDDGVPHIGDEEADYSRDLIRAVAASMFSVLLTTASRILGLGIERKSDVIRVHITGRLLAEPACGRGHRIVPRAGESLESARRRSARERDGRDGPYSSLALQSIR